MDNPYKAKTQMNSKMTTTERRELEAIEKRQAKEMRNFWVRVMNRQGFTNTAIAKEMKISESTVRYSLTP